jgi:hypothetical protein
VRPKKFEHPFILVLLFLSGFSVELQTKIELVDTSWVSMKHGTGGANLGLYGDVRKTHDLEMLKALQTSSATLGVAVAVKHTTRSALISSTNRATDRKS